MVEDVDPELVATAAALRAVPRHEFVPAAGRDLAYADRPLLIGDGQTISGPGSSPGITTTHISASLLYDWYRVMITRGMSRSDSEKVVSVSARGQATIPKEFREELGIETPGRVKFVRTGDGDIVVRPIRSIKDLRGILADKTDEQGQSATELLREERERDEASEAALRDRYTDADEGDE